MYSVIGKRTKSEVQG